MKGSIEIRVPSFEFRVEGVLQFCGVAVLPRQSFGNRSTAALLHGSTFFNFRHPRHFLMRIGFGYDVHPLVAGRKLILGGVEIPFEKGLEGHSDADVLLHAVCDALLGAIGEGDIGKHFPNTDPRFRGISSLRLLEAVASKLTQKLFGVENVDVSVVAEKPKIAAYISRMIEQISRSLNLAPERVNIKATTSEGLGFVGEGKGIAAYAVVLLKEVPNSGFRPEG